MKTFIFSLGFTLSLLNSFALTSSSDFATDRESLLAFKNDVTSDPYGVLSSNWTGSGNASVCGWTGVSCGVGNGRVTAIALSGFSLGGTIAPHLGNLTFLQSLDISNNSFRGALPSHLSNLRDLKEMNVGLNLLEGDVSEQIGALSSLETLNLEGNRFTGVIQSRIFTNMSALMEINLRNNKLSGELPNEMCLNSPELRRIYLSGNQLHGRIPASICKCRRLEELSFSRNQFSGEIPSELGNLTMLTSLVMKSNHLEGEIPASIFNISSLEYVDLFSNSLSGSIPAFNYLPNFEELYLSSNSLTGRIPKPIGNLTLLKTLDVAANKLIGELPEELGNLARIEVVDFSFNDFLNGSIPPSIFNLSRLKRLSLQQNQFSGSLPPNMGLSLFNLEEIYLYWNRLSGEIPSSINNASKLIALELNNNSFTGSIPDFGNLRLLQILRLWLNNLSANQRLHFLSSLINSPDLKYLEISYNPMMNGVIPTSVGNLSSSLLRFAASDCSIRGVIPSEFGNLSSLETLDLSMNRLEGFIPETFGRLKLLEKLHLYENQLGGYIPQELCQMSRLGELQLFVNKLSGPIPECLGGVSSLRTVSFASNNLDSSLPSSFFNLADLIILSLASNYFSGQLPYQIGSLKAMNRLDLSYNNFSGVIPSSIGSCESLEFLYLSNNRFNGSIPQSLGEIKGLSELDLSNNDLSGSIPESLENLDLHLFNVSYNLLEGEIPDGGSFANLNAQSFLNNSALCGTPRFQVPPCRNRKSEAKNVAVLMIYIVPPFVAVLILVVGIVILMRRCRPRKPPPETDNLGVDWISVSEIELKQRTNSFSETNLLGRGSISSVYKATLADGTDVAAKVFNLQLEGATKSFETESKILSTIRHRNLVKILGCCSNTEFKALILAYMPNGSLEKWLHFDGFFLDLVQRLEIAKDVALALEYLHHGYSFPIVHCDIKPSNVLLDADMTARVSDCGISKLFDDGETAVHTTTMATIGYAAPEFGSEGKVSTRGDVYSYGILLLEMFTSKRPTHEMFSSEMSIKRWVGEALQENAIMQIVAPGLLSREDQHLSTNLQCVASVFELAMKCLSFSAEERIDMVEVVVALHKIKPKVPAMM